MVTHSAVTVTGLPYTAAGFDHSSHDRHVAAGGCPVVQSSKAWCVLKAGHHGNRRQPYRDHASETVTADTPRGHRGTQFWTYP